MIILGADHGGFELKEYLKDYLYKQGHEIYDVGAFEYEGLDSFAEVIPEVIKLLRQDESNRAIVLCGSGVGVCVGCNRYKGVYAANCHEAAEAQLARMHNNINVLNLGGRFISKSKAKKMVKAFLETECIGGKYIDRMERTNTYND